MYFVLCYVHFLFQLILKVIFISNFMMLKNQKTYKKTKRPTFLFNLFWWLVTDYLLCCSWICIQEISEKYEK